MASSFDSQNIVILSGLCLSRLRAIHHHAHGDCYAMRLLVYRQTSKRHGGRGYSYSRVPLVLPPSIGETALSEIHVDTHLSVRAEVRVSYEIEEPVVELIVLGYSILAPTEFKVADIYQGGKNDSK